MSVKRLLLWSAALWAVAASCLSPVCAHDMPLSYVDLRIGDTGIEASVQAPAIDLAHDLPDVTPNMLLTPAGAEKHKQRLAALLTSRFVVLADGEKLGAQLRGIEIVPDQKDLRLRLRFTGNKGTPHALDIRCRLFPHDSRHKTFLDIYRGKTLARQAIFDGNVAALSYRLGSRQKTLAVIGQFVVQGVYHIFIGPDHILFIVGLLLLGGTLRHLLKIVTAFTLAHSLTLALATLGIWNPPARIIEPAIALSIVFVGVHSLMANREKRGLRLLFAFVFGFIHGFGFASVLRELELPRYALGWSLFSFNFGVEIGQACIVLAVAPLLALLRKRSQIAARRVVFAGSLVVILAGAYWFGERLAS